MSICAKTYAELAATEGDLCPVCGHADTVHVDSEVGCWGCRRDAEAVTTASAVPTARPPFAIEYRDEVTYEQHIEAAVFQALGAASLAWSERPRGEFDIEYAQQIGRALTAEIIRLR